MKDRAVLEAYQFRIVFNSLELAYVKKGFKVTRVHLSFLKSSAYL